VFIDDREFVRLWNTGERFFVLSDGDGIAHLKQTGGERLFLVAESGGKTLYSNLSAAP
jgi:hypothetical protein